MRPRTRRLVIISVAGSLLIAASTLAYYGIRDAIVFFVGPSEAIERGVIEGGQRVRLGGLVAEGSVVRGQGETMTFDVTDGVTALKVTYTGPVPDLFKENQGVIAEGRFRATDQLFIADRVLARHDEQYIPREVKKTLEEQGHWQPEDAGEPGPAPPPSQATPTPIGYPTGQ